MNSSHPFHVNNPAVQEAMREDCAKAWDEGHRHCKCHDLGMRHANPYVYDSHRPHDCDYLISWCFDAKPFPCEKCGKGQQ